MALLTSRLAPRAGAIAIAVALTVVVTACSSPLPSLNNDLSPPSDAVLVEGEVTDVVAGWDADGSAIITQATITRTDGSAVTVHQLGGTVDGVGMLASHHPDVLRAGQLVQLAARPSGTEDFVLHQVLVNRSGLQAEEEVGSARYGINRTKLSATPLNWASGCIHLSYHGNGITHLPGNSEFRILDEAAAEWQLESNVCSGLTFSSSVTANPGVGRNRINSVTFREDRWCRPATATSPEVCHDPNAIAVTQVFFVDDPDSPRDGTILEADIEYNGVNFAFTDNGQTLGQAPRTADLRSTTTHEIGHLLGLAHNCWTGIENRPADHNGNVVPSCSDIESGSEVTEATMYFQQDEGEVKKASLETSDVLGACAGLGGIECDRVVRSGCSAGMGSSGPVQLALFMLALLLALRRTRYG